MDEPERLGDPAGVAGLRLERKQQLHKLFALLARLVDVDADEFRHVVGGEILVAAAGVGHDGDLSGFLVGEVRATLEPFEKIVRPVG